MKEIHLTSGEPDPLQSADAAAEPSPVHQQLLTLRQWMSMRQREMPQAFGRLARSITASVGRLHQQHRLHLGLHPDLIRVSEDGRDVELTDHGSVPRRLADGSALPLAGSLPIAALPYCAPENTGRMLRTVDERSDLYSLGVIFYELLAGQLPFQADDPLEWIYMHLAHSPAPLAALQPQLAEGLEAIVMKLLEKNPVKRYPSAAFLLADLDKLGRPHDAMAARSGFYGRERELAVLSQAFRSVCLGSTEIVHISGAAGIGKTSLMDEVFRKQLHEQHYFYISGKFEHLSKESPYRPIIQAFRGLMRHILGERNERADAWKSRLLKALGSGAGIIAEMIPEAGILLGTVPDVEVLPAHESKKRFIYAFRKFVQALASKEYPLVLFVDDLQWADASSLQLMHALISDPECQYVMLVCAYRDTLADRSVLPGYAPDGSVVEEAAVHHLHLAPLSLMDMNRMMIDTLRQPAQDTMTLTELLYHQSGGNPFYFGQLLRRLQDDRIVSYSDELRCWQWNLGQLLEQSPGYSLHELVEHKLQRLSASAQELLRVAACIGTAFHPLFASRIAGLSEESSAPEWSRLEAEGLVIAEGTELLRLTHDNIQKLIYQNISEARRQQLHLAIGNQLNGRQTGWSEPLFDAVNHLNRGAGLIAEEQEKLQLIRLNLEAGQRAKASTAYDVALGYLSKGTEQAAAVRWQEQFELMFELHCQKAECEYLCGHAARSSRSIAMLLERARTPVERSRIQMIGITQLINQGKYLEGTALGLQSLKELQVFIPADPGSLLLTMEAKRTELMLRRSMDKLNRMEAMTDQDRIAAINLIFAIIPSTFFTDKKIFFLLICRAVQLHLRHGSTPASAAVYPAFSMLLGEVFPTPEQAYALCRTGVELAERYNVSTIKCKAYTIFGGVLCQFAGDARDGDDYLIRAVQLGMESGDYVFASYAAGAHVNSLYTRAALDELARAIADYMAVLDTTKDEFVRQNFYLYQQYILALKGRTDAPDSFDSLGFSEEQYLARIRREETSVTSLFQYHTYKVQLYYLLGRYEEAVRWAAQAKQYESYATHLPHLPECRFYSLLALIAGSGRSRIHLKKIKRGLRRFQHWPRWSPANYQSRYDLLQAEYARLQGNHQMAEAMYDQALREARERGHLHITALASELAAAYYLEAGKQKTAMFYMQSALEGYSQWGLDSKLAELQERQSLWQRGEMRPAPERNDMSHNTAMQPVVQQEANADALPLHETDLAAILRTTQAIANRTDLHAILDEILNTIVKYAGASKGALLTASRDRLYIQAYVDGDTGGGRAPTELEDSALLPEGIIRYVYRTQEDVHYYGDGDSWLVHNPYFAAHRPQSALCLPVQVHGAMLGVLYLENKLTEGVFPHNRKAVLLAMASHGIFLCMLQSVPDQEEREQEQAQNEESLPLPDVMEEPLTDRELEVLALLAKGMSNKEIADQLIIAVGTVKVHVKNIFAKLKVNRRMNAVTQANELRLLAQHTRR